MNKYIVEITNLSKIYQTRGETVHVLDNTNMQFLAENFYGVVGHSGSGKSTLLNLIGCMDIPSSGSIFIKGIDTSTLSDKQLSRLRNQEIGFIFQQYNLLARLTVMHNLRIPQFYCPSKKCDEKKFLQLLDFVGLKDKANRYPVELSGGEQQRVAIARALVNEPAILLADEPTGNLDEQNANGIIELFRRLNKELKLAIIMITHNIDLTNYCDFVIKIQNGKIVPYK